MGSAFRFARYLLPIVVVVAIVASFASCASDPSNAAGDNGPNVPPGGGDVCATPNEGCPCEVPDQEVDCGQVKHQSGDYISCAMGRRTCAAGKWGACNSSHIIVKSMMPGGLGTRAITQGPCPSTGPLANPCDPYCNQAIDDAGIQIAPPAAGGCQYYEPASRVASYAALPASHRGNPGACTSGTNDNCGYDSSCSGGTCSFFTAGQTNACTGWDLTFPPPCDNSGAETFVICNRGQAPANSGTITGVLTDATIQGRSSSVSLYKAPTNATRRGNCTFNLTTNPIAPGTCRNFTMASACPGADWTTGSTVRTIQFNMPDWSAAGDPARVAGECNDKNNFTTWASGALLACQGVGCTGTGGGISLNTTNNGNSSCPPGPQLYASTDGTCTSVNQYATCQQDFRCVNPGTAGSKCVWNGGEGYYDPAAGGSDLTLGAPCSNGGTDTFPVCNRGSAPVPSGASVNIHIGGSASIADSCAPGPITCTSLLGAALAPGKCMNLQCATSGNAYATVSLTGATEAAGRCANNQTYAKTCPGSTCTQCDTRVSGVVYDPSGVAGAGAPYANTIGLAGISVFEPVGPLASLADGTPAVSCDSCASLDTTSSTRAVTSAAGGFTLSGVTPGPATRIVVQSGRWRREISMPVTACADNSPTAGTFRMPRSTNPATDGSISSNIPKMAMVTGNQETLACLMRRIGVASSEFSGGTGTRIRIYRNNGMNITGAPNHTTLYTLNELSNYHAVFLDCDGGAFYNSGSKTNAQMTAFQDYGARGGRVFIDHWAGELLRDGPTPNSSNTVTTWQDHNNLSTTRGRVMLGTYPQQLFHDWLNAVGALGPAPFITVSDPREHALIPGTAATRWIGGLLGNTGGAWAAGATPNYSLSMSFETPVGAADCGVAGGHGRFMYNGMHVSAIRGTGGTFPNDCAMDALTNAEKALEYQIFQLTACQLGGAPPPPPPPPVATTYVTRDFEGVCPEGTFPEWQFFRWQSVTPPGTSIEFRAATADSQATLPAGPAAPAAPISVGAGTASGATIADPNWGSDAQTVSWHLYNDPAGRNELSKRWLRVYMRFNPIGAVAPSITQYRQDYSCKPAE